MTARHRITATLLLTMALALTGCAAPADNPTPTATPARSQQPQQAGTPNSGGDFATLQSQREAAETAAQTMSVLVTHKDSYDAWWGALSPLLTAEAATDWEYTDPARITATQVTGPAQVVDAPTSTQVFVDVPTDAGPWRLELVRMVESGAGAAPWTVLSLQPPGTNSTPSVG